MFMFVIGIIFSCDYGGGSGDSIWIDIFVDRCSFFGCIFKIDMEKS